VKLQIFIIEEPIHIDDEIACKLWQKTLWVKEKGYRKYYKTSIMPIGVDDFFATHYIVAEAKTNGQYEPLTMLKLVTRTQSEKFNIPFGAEALLKNAGLANAGKIEKILRAPEEIAYISSFTLNPDYKMHQEFSNFLRNYITAYICNYLPAAGINRWLAAGVTRYKIDKYIEWLGGKEILPPFSLPIIDNQTVRMMYIENTDQPSSEALSVADTLKSDWENRIVFKPNSNKGALHVFRAA
jgi:hypothetical protein